MARTSHRTSPFTQHFIRPCGNIALSFWLRPCKRTPGTPTELSRAAPELFSSYVREKRVVFPLPSTCLRINFVYRIETRLPQQSYIWQYNFQALSKYWIMRASFIVRSYVINYCNWNRETSRRKVAFFVMNYSRNLKSNFTFGKNFEKEIKMLKFYESKICPVI